MIIDGLFFTFSLLTILSGIGNIIAFGSPYWIQSRPSTNSQFKNIGIWTACFDGFMLPTRFDIAFFGCHYVYGINIDPIRHRIIPCEYFIQTSSTVCRSYNFQIIHPNRLEFNLKLDFILIVRIRRSPSCDSTFLVPFTWCNG